MTVMDGSQLKDHCQKKLNEAKMKVETIQASDPTNPNPDKLTPFNPDQIRLIDQVV